MEVRAKLWLEENGRFVIGAGRAELLRRVKETGSISEAAKAMGMSYSHAWSEIREMSGAAGNNVVRTSRGGNAGGSTELTLLGERLLETFDREMERLGRHLAETGD